MATRRKLLAYVLGAGLLVLGAPQALASGGDDGGGGSGSSGSGSSGGGGSDNDGGGSDDGGGDDGGSSNSGSGSSNSGSSNSGSSNDDDDDNDDEDDDEQTHARKAVQRGDAIALKKVLANVNRQYPGRVVSVSLRGKGKGLQYRIKVIDKRNRLLNLVVNAQSGQITKAD